MNSQYKLIRCTINGKAVEKMVDVRASLTDMLRNDFRLTSVKKGCEVGECGACNVLIDGECFNSCLYLAAWADGKNIRTLEGLMGPGHRLPPQQRLVGDQEHGPVHIPQGCEAQADGVAGAPVRAVVDHHLEPTAPGQGLHLRVLGHHHGGAEQLRRHRVQGPPDQAPALQLRQELVGAEPRPVPRRHHHAADPRRHAVTPFPGGGA